MFTISNLLQRLNPEARDLSVIIDEKSYAKRKKEIDPGLESDEGSDATKEERFRRVQEMLANAKADIALQNLGI